MRRRPAEWSEGWTQEGREIKDIDAQDREMRKHCSAMRVVTRAGEHKRVR